MASTKRTVHMINVYSIDVRRAPYISTTGPLQNFPMAVPQSDIETICCTNCCIGCHRIDDVVVVVDAVVIQVVASAVRLIHVISCPIDDRME